MGAFEIARSATIQADPARLHALVDDFRQWTAWSPWEDIDPALQRTYSGPGSGVGAHYAWAGNRRAGRGSMVITSSSAERIDIELTFLKPWQASNDVTFTFAPSGTATDVTWRMSGEQRGMAAIFGRLFNMDKLLGKDFEKGLARLKGVAEAPA
jgi:hypothetical protein